MSTESKGGKPRFYCYLCDSGFCATLSSGSTRCPNCEGTLDTTRARMSFFGKNKTVRRLAEGPATSSEVNVSASIRDLIWKIKVPSGSVGAKPRPGARESTTVYYLAGDEREAMRLFIEENEEFIRSVLNDGPGNRLSYQWSDDMYTILLEQWHFEGYDER